METTASQVTGDPPIAKDGNLILTDRIRKPVDAINLHAKLYNDDRPRSADRAMIQALLDNMPPVDPRTMAAAGRGNCSNFNPGDGENVFAEEISPYIGLAYSGRTLMEFPIRGFGAEQERTKWSTIIAEEVTDTIRAWPDFLSRWQLGVMWMKRDGLSFAIHDDPISWQWKVHPLEEVKFPNRTQIGVNNFEYISMEIEMPPHKLYEKIKDENTAKLLGYNIARARAALMNAAPTQPITTDWEAWEEMWKNNDYLMGGDQNPVVKLIYVYCRELGGKVTQLITRSGDEGEEDFIFKKAGKFTGMDKFLYPMLENLGSNGTYHAIRGVGHKIYSKAMQIAVLANKFADQIDFDTTPILKTGNDVDGDDMETQQFGFFTVLPNTYTLEKRETPNYAQSIIPGIEYFRQMMSRSTSKNSQSAIQNDPSVSRYVLDAAMRNDSQVTGLAEFLFYASQEALFREVLRRLFQKDYDPVLPGGTEAADLKRRIFERGVPMEALDHIDISRMRMNRVIGGGNENIRAMKLQSLQGTAGNFDPIGRSRYQHDVVASILDERAADYYSPVTEVTRLPDDAGIAQTENELLVMGGSVVPLDGQNDEVHCMMHIQKLSEFGEMVVGQSLNLVEVTPPMRKIHDHTMAHVGRMDANSPITKQIVEVLEQYLGMIENGELQILRQQEAQQADAAQNGGAPGQPTPEQVQQDQKITADQLVATIKAQQQARNFLHETKMLGIKEEKAKADLETHLIKAAATKEAAMAKAASAKVVLDAQTAAKVRQANKPAAQPAE